MSITSSFLSLCIVQLSLHPSSKSIQPSKKTTPTHSSSPRLLPIVTAQTIMKNTPDNLINFNTKTLIIGDSNPHHQIILFDLTQILYKPSAKIHNIRQIFQNMTTSCHPNLAHIYILIGLNDRENNFYTTQDNWLNKNTVLNEHASALHCSLYLDLLIFHLTKLETLTNVLHSYMTISFIFYHWLHDIQI